MCSVCGKSFFLRKCEIPKIKTCSKECSSIHKSKKRIGIKHKIIHKKEIPITCSFCSTVFCRIYKFSKKQNIFCSDECKNSFHSINYRKEKHQGWKGGISKNNRYYGMAKEYSDWRKKVYERDGYKCTKCGDNKKLHAHHIIFVSVDRSKMLDVNNGMTLCEKCHGEIHGIDFSIRRGHKCLDCDKKTSSKSGRCRSCATKNQWKKNDKNVQKRNLWAIIRNKIKLCLDCNKQISKNANRCNSCSGKVKNKTL